MLNKSLVHIVASNSTGSFGYSAKSENGWLIRDKHINSRGWYAINDAASEYEFKVQDGNYQFRRITDKTSPNLPISARRSYFGHWLSGSAPLNIVTDKDFAKIDGLILGESKLPILAVHRSILVDGKELPKSKLPRHIAVVVADKEGGRVIGANFTPKNEFEKVYQVLGWDKAKLIESTPPPTPKKSVVGKAKSTPAKTAPAAKQVKVN